MKLKELKYQRFILSTRPILWLPLYRKDGDTILSSDGYGHLCTVSGGPLWTLQGRQFVGVGGVDWIDLPANSILTPTTGSVLCWIYRSTTTAGYVYSSNVNELSVYSNAGATNNLVDIYYAGSQRLRATADINKWHLIGYSFTNTTTGGFTYVDGVNQQNGVTMGTTAPTISGAPRIQRGSDGVTSGVPDTLGDFLMYNRNLTPIEHLQIFLITKWRY